MSFRQYVDENVSINLSNLPGQPRMNISHVHSVLVIDEMSMSFGVCRNLVPCFVQGIKHM